MARVISARDAGGLRRLMSDEPRLVFYKVSTILLQSYAKKGDLEAVRFMLDNGTWGAHVALAPAATGNQREVMAFLLSRGVSVNEVGLGMTALMMAAHCGHVESVSYLLDRGADPNIQTRNGDTAVTLAKKHGYQNIVEFLEERAAVVDHTLPQDGTRRR